MVTIDHSVVLMNVHMRANSSLIKELLCDSPIGFASDILPYAGIIHLNLEIEFYGTKHSGETVICRKKRDSDVLSIRYLL